MPVNKVSSSSLVPVPVNIRRSSSSDSSIAGKIRNLWNTLIALIKGRSEAQIPGVSKRGRMPLDASTKNILNALVKEYKTSSYAVNTSLTYGPANRSDIPKFKAIVEASIDKGTVLTLIPFVVQGRGSFTLPHIVLMSVDLGTKEIRYFDSKGRSSLDYFIDDGFSVADILKECLSSVDVESGISDGVDDEWMIVENLDPRQKDTFSCGYHVVCQAAVEMNIIKDYDHNDPRQTIIDNGWNVFGDVSGYKDINLSEPKGPKFDSQHITFIEDDEFDESDDDKQV